MACHWFWCVFWCLFWQWPLPETWRLTWCAICSDAYSDMCCDVWFGKFHATDICAFTCCGKIHGAYILTRVLTFHLAAWQIFTWYVRKIAEIWKRNFMLHTFWSASLRWDSARLAQSHSRQVCVFVMREVPQPHFYQRSAKNFTSSHPHPDILC